MIIHEFDLDMIPGGQLASVRLNQYDEDFVLRISLFSRNGNFSVQAGTTVRIRGTKPDGNAFSADCTISGNTVTVTGDQQMTAAAGRAVFELSLLRSGRELNTANFILDVEQAALDKDTVGSRSVVRELVEIMDNSEEIINAGHQYAESQAAMTELTERSEAAAASAQADRERTEEVAAQTDAKWTAVSEQIDRKSAAIATLVTNADEVAAQASETANSALNEVAEVANTLDSVQEWQERQDLKRPVYDGYVDDGVAIFVDEHGEELFRITGIGGGGGGGQGGGSADQTTVSKVTMDNTTGWLSKTIGGSAPCPVTFTWSSNLDGIPTGNGVLSISVNNIIRATMDVEQGDVEIDLAPYATATTNRIELRVTDVEGQYKRITFTITVLALSISSTFDVSTPYTGAISFPFTPVGAIEKTVHFVLDGEEIGTQTTSVTNRQISYLIPAQPHGSHSLRVWFDAEVNGEAIRSNELYYEFISLATLDDEVIITSPYDQATQPQYASIAIPFTVYDPVSDTAEVSIYANGELVSTQTVDRTEQSYTYRANTAGPLTIEIRCRNTTKAINITVIESEVDAEAETNDLMLYMTALGRSNNEAHPEVWTSDAEGSAVAASLTGFNWTSNGWVADEDGITCLRVSGGARVAIPYQMFAADARLSGLTLIVEYATRNVADYNATVLSCMNGGRGLAFTPQRATLTSEQTELYMQYREGEHISAAFVVDKRSQDRLVKNYINGKIARVAQYPADDDFSQVSPAGIAIGADNCTIDIYSIRVYANNLTDQQILDTWIADTQDGALMLERYARNQVMDAYGQVVSSALPASLPFMVIEAEELPQFKGDKKTVSVEYTDRLYPSNSFTATKTQANVQGTSSAPYYVKNEDLQFKNGFEMASGGGHARVYRLTVDAMPGSRFVIKADVASSESANNVELVDLYNELCPYKTPEMLADPRVRWGIKGIPIVVFWRDTTTGETKFVGKFNFNYPKRFPEGLGYTGDQESWEWQNNTSDRMLFKSDDFDSMYTDPETMEEYPAWRNDFEARFPEDTWDDTTKLKEWISWVVSTDRDQATGNALASPVTYKGVEYTHDTAEYRLAKFDAELEDYAQVETLIFYYVFTETFLMVDSRAKNLFMGFHGDECELAGSAIDRKVVAEPYDMDTGLGTNNEGTLTYTYSLEDTDTIDGADVFNGQHSVLWCNLRDTRRADIVNMYQTLRSSGKFSAAAVDERFVRHQSAWPEAIWNEDALKKYIEPLTDPAGGKEPTDFYLPMCQGSKEQQRAWWLHNRFAYMDSKWNAGDALAQVIQLRGYAKSDITVTPYIDLYPTVKYGSYLVQARGRAGMPTTLECPMDNVNDTEIYVYSARNIADIGDISGLKVGVADFSPAVNIQRVVAGKADTGYTNPNMKSLSFGSNTLLKTVDVRGCINLGTGDRKNIDMSGCTILEEAYFDRTAIQGLALPNGGVLRVLHLPGTVTNLTIRNQRLLEEFVIPSYDNVSTLWLEGNSSAIDMLAILNAVPASTRVHLVGVAWEASTAADIRAILAKLNTMRGLDEVGNNQERAYVSGSIHIASLTGAEMAEFEGQYPYPYLRILADHTTSYRTYADEDGTVIKRVRCIDGVPDEGAPTGMSKAATAQYTYTFAGWSKSMYAETADADALDNVMADRTVYAAYSKTVNTYPITWKDGSTTLRTDTLEYGAMPSWGQAMPTNGSGQTAQGWTPDIVAVTGPATYTASYIPVYTVYFYNGTELLKQQQVQQGGSATPPAGTPSKTGVDDPENYTFTGYSPSYTNVQGNISTYAQFKQATGAPTATTADGAYGVEWDYGSSSTVLTRKGLAASFGNPVPAESVSGSGSSPFDAIAPWKDMKIVNVKSDGTILNAGDPGFSMTAEDTMVYIPEFYYTAYKDTASHKWLWAISPTKLTGYAKHPGSGRYIGRYHTGGDSSAVFSKSGVAPLANTSQTDFRTYSKAKGSGWYMLDLASWSALQMLYLVEFANWDSQAVLGTGYDPGSAAGVMGGTDGAAYHTLKASKAHNQYRWVEDPFSNVLDWIDGFMGSKSAIYVGTDNAAFNGSTSNLTRATGLKLPSSGYITGFGYSEESAWAFIPDAASGGSGTTYVADFVGSNTSAYPASVGGSYNSSDFYGVFYFSANYSASVTYAGIGSRLLFAA